MNLVGRRPQRDGPPVLGGGCTFLFVAAPVREQTDKHSGKLMTQIVTYGLGHPVLGLMALALPI